MRAANLTAESGLDSGLGWEWLQARRPLARSGWRGGHRPGSRSEPSYQALVATLELGEDRRADRGVYAPALHSEEAMLGCSVAEPCWGRNSGGGSCSLSFSQGLLVPLKAVQTGTQDLAAGCLATWLSILILPHICVCIHIQAHAHVHM